VQFGFMKPSLSKSILAAALLLAACTQMPLMHQQASNLPTSQGSIVTEAPVAPPKGMIDAGAPSVKVGLLIPLSGDSVAVGNAMLDAATMAVSDAYLTTPSDQIHSRIILIPKDTGQTAAETKVNAQQAIDQGATFIIGPLFSQSVAAVAPIAKEHHIKMLTFSNNSAVAEDGVYVFGFLPEQQVSRMAEYAYLHNLTHIALLAPNDAYGEKIKTKLLESYSQKGGTVAPAELYAPSPTNINAAVARLSQAYVNAKDDRRFDAIFIAEGGAQLKNIIAALKRSKIDLKKVKLLGTGQWDDADIATIPEMEGAWFPSAPPESHQIFEKRFFAAYGYKPVRLASLAYDAVTLASALTMATPGTGITKEAITNPAGFIGPANSLYRLDPDGTSERKLGIMEVTDSGFKVIDPAPKHF